MKLSLKRLGWYFKDSNRFRLISISGAAQENHKRVLKENFWSRVSFFFFFSFAYSKSKEIRYLGGIYQHLMRVRDKSLVFCPLTSGKFLLLVVTPLALLLFCFTVLTLDTVRLCWRISGRNPWPKIIRDTTQMDWVVVQKRQLLASGCCSLSTLSTGRKS